MVKGSYKELVVDQLHASRLQEAQTFSVESDSDDESLAQDQAALHARPHKLQLGDFLKGEELQVSNSQVDFTRGPAWSELSSPPSEQYSKGVESVARLPESLQDQKKPSPSGCSIWRGTAGVVWSSWLGFGRKKGGKIAPVQTASTSGSFSSSTRRASGSDFPSLPSPAASGQDGEFDAVVLDKGGTLTEEWDVDILGADEEFGAMLVQSLKVRRTLEPDVQTEASPTGEFKAETRSWAAVLGSVTRTEPVGVPHAAQGSRQTSGRQPPETNHLASLDSAPGKGFEWEPLKEHRDPRNRAGKWKGAKPRRNSPPPRGLGNSRKFCNLCLPGLSQRLDRKDFALQEARQHMGK